MGKRVNCPVCGAQCAANRYEREGCWACADDAERQAEANDFALFMRQDEEVRWRLLWAAAGKPSPY